MGLLNTGFINFIEVVGLISFSISGVIAALDKKLDMTITNVLIWRIWNKVVSYR